MEHKKMATAKKKAPAEPKIPRQIKSKMVKEKICAAATDLIKSHGYEYVTVSNVCNAAEVSVGSFYHHFTNKDDLLGYYLTAAFENYAAEFENISGDDVVSNVVRCFDLYIDFLLEQGLEFTQNYYTTKNRNLSANSAQGNSKPVNMPILEKAEEFIIKAQENGFVYSGVDAKILADDLCIVEKGTIFDWCICSGSYDLREYADRILRAHLRAYVTDAYLEKFADSFK